MEGFQDSKRPKSTKRVIHKLVGRYRESNLEKRHVCTPTYESMSYYLDNIPSGLSDDMVCRVCHDTHISVNSTEIERTEIDLTLIEDKLKGTPLGSLRDRLVLDREIIKRKLKKLRGFF